MTMEVIWSVVCTESIRATRVWYFWMSSLISGWLRRSQPIVSTGAMLFLRHSCIF